MLQFILELLGCISTSFFVAWIVIKFFLNNLKPEWYYDNGCIRLLRMRGKSNSASKKFLPKEGEPVYDVENRVLYVGDGKNKVQDLKPLLEVNAPLTLIIYDKRWTSMTLNNGDLKVGKTSMESNAYLGGDDLPGA